MTTATKTALIFTFIMGMGVGLIGTAAYYGEQSMEAHTPPETACETRTVEKVPMSVRELQTFLNEAGHSRYACEIDGKMGKETQKAWDNYICDQYAKESFK